MITDEQRARFTAIGHAVGAELRHLSAEELEALMGAAVIPAAQQVMRKNPGNPDVERMLAEDGDEIMRICMESARDAWREGRHRG